MAVSGNQQTRIGASVSGVAKKLVILAKGAPFPFLFPRGVHGGKNITRGGMQ